MLRDVRVHGMDEADVVDALTHMGKDFADPLAALAVLLEPEGRGEEPVLGIPKGLPVNDFGALSLVFPDLGFVVEGVDLGGSAGHEQLDHALGPGSEVGSLGGQMRTLRRKGRPRNPGPQTAVLGQDTGESQDTESRAQPVQHVASVQRRWRQGVKHGSKLLKT